MPDAKPYIRVQLDKNTVITVSKIKTLEVWKEKYPDLKVISK